MGCCLSSPRSQSHSPYPTSTPTADASARNITTSSPPQSSINTPRASHGRRPSNSSSTAHPSAQPVTCAPNHPLLLIPSTKRSHLPRGSRWTQARLDKERNDFFDTRVTGRPEIWGAIRIVVELLRQGKRDEAQGILDASAVTCPTGEIWKGVFDEKGNLYAVPEWVIVEPAHLVEDANAEGKADEAGDEDDEMDGLSKEEKGKGRAIEIDPSTIAKVRARLSDRSSDVLVKMSKDERLAVLVRKIRDVANLPPSTKIRIYYMGKELKESESLSSQGWAEGHVVNAFVYSPA